MISKLSEGVAAPAFHDSVVKKSAAVRIAARDCHGPRRFGACETVSPKTVGRTRLCRRPASRAVAWQDVPCLTFPFLSAPAAGGRRDQCDCGHHCAGQDERGEAGRSVSVAGKVLQKMFPPSEYYHKPPIAAGEIPLSFDHIPELGSRFRIKLALHRSLMLVGKRVSDTDGGRWLT